MKKNILITALLIFLASAFSFAQTTNTGTSQHYNVVGHPDFQWSVALGDFDSAATVWSPPFSFNGYVGSTFDVQGSINLGTVASAGTYSTILLLYGCNDDPGIAANWVLCDSLGTVTATTATKISVDLDDWDQCTWYEIKAYNNGGDNSFTLGLKSEYDHSGR